MFQTDDAAAFPASGQMGEGRSVFETLKGLGFEDAMTGIANGLVQFTFRLLIAVLVFYVGKFIIKKLYNLVYKIMVNRKVDVSLTTFILSMIRIVLYFILIITIIGIIGIETSSFLALFASAGVAIGMALSGTLQNFAGGVLILLLKPYKVGDYIEAQGFSGTVKEIQIFHTVINTPDNKAIIIPNGGLSTGTINNYSHEDYRRVDWKVGLSYGNDYSAAREAILRMLDSDERVVKKYIEDDIIKRGDDSEPRTLLNKKDCSPFVGLGELADSSVNIVVRAWTHSSNYWPLFYGMNERFYKELPEMGFSFPFPQLDVHIVKNQD